MKKNKTFSEFIEIILYFLTNIVYNTRHKEVLKLSSLGNAEIFAKNLRYYVDKSGKTSKQLASIIGVATPTFSEWLNGKKYPRIDKIERLANYFGIQKSDLIEDHSIDEVSYMPIRFAETKVLCQGFEEMPPETRAMIMGMFNAAYAQFKQQQGKDDDDDTAET